jgi:hypothetical protein
MSDNAALVNLDYQQVNYLLELLRKRTPEELVIGALLFAPAFTPEMRQALILLHLERSTGGVHNGVAPPQTSRPIVNRRAPADGAIHSPLIARDQSAPEGADRPQRDQLPIRERPRPCLSVRGDYRNRNPDRDSTDARVWLRRRHKGGGLAATRAYSRF